MGKSVTDEDYTDMLLASLPTSYDGAVSSISMSVCLGLKALTAEIFKQLILDKAEQRQVKDRYMENRDEAQAADSSKQKGKDKSKDKRKELNATIVTRLNITSPNVGPKEVARKAKDCSGAEAQRTMPLRP